MKAAMNKLGLGFLLAFVLVANAFAAATAAEYAERLRQAEKVTDNLIEGEPSPVEIVATMNSIKGLLPAHEEVEFGGQVVRVDNSWLHEAIALIVKNANGDEEQVRSMLVEIADRLLLLEQRIVAAQKQTDAGQDQSAQLERILARSEYLPEEKKESSLRQWGRKLLDKILALLARLFGGRRVSPGGFGQGGVSAARIVIMLILLAAASFGLVKLLRYLQRRRKKDKENEVREVLGEELPDDVTAAELLTNANELARQGDFRSAIRRAYIALLCELEQRGKVHLHRAKTNRDYLDELKPEASLYPTFSVMTGAFEHVWYGHEPATASEYSDFIALYQETVN
ncbi:MAG TPA: DUF4129 domain-containing protein [Blastocatellia bacterium]|nr:DUF4129 domain-containing protein [Blastocatellia bacterium]HMX30354.1 DUF4129 domain-containing protein [Blastocatellia bacterium]HMY75201.1 DUF4129 domain-containing protein [Blastocatellia bacterium]HMZ22253.1 DUF4129 domain-containing protein [Blastocatellia bacterium]HNG29563.1 DUF4129 domain-containing protein [Blastocatellia bacterium]